MSTAASAAHAPPAIEEVRRFALMVARGEARDFDPEDVAQDVMERYLRNIAAVRDWQRWVRTTTKNRIIDLRRARHDYGSMVPGRVAQLTPAVVGPSVIVIAQQALDTVLDGLGDREREVALAYLGGSSNEEIAELCGYASAAAVATILSRVRRKARTILTADALEPQRVYDVGRAQPRIPRGYRPE